MITQLVIWLALSSHMVDAFWRMACDNPLTFERLDPIVNPGTYSGHVHNVAGGSNFGPSADYSALRQSACTSCPIKEDLSAYWTPALYYQYSNGSFISVPNGGTTVYYLQRGATASSPIKAFPAGFRMISGKPTLRTYDATSRAQRAINFVCLNFQTGTTFHTELPNKDCPDGLRLQVVFPSCWDGVNLDSADHKSHVAFPTGISTGTCDDPKFPVRLITIFYEIFYSSTVFKDMWYGDSQPFVLASGDPTGYGFHADFLNGWDVPVLQKAIDTCTSDTGSIDACPVFTIQHPSSKAAGCHKSPSVNEVVMNTVLQELPGCNPVTYTATAPGTCTKPAPELWTNTTGYYGSIVPPGYHDLSGVSVLKSYKNWKYLGCYQDTNARVFPKRFSTSNVGSCLDTCQTNGYSYGGLEYGQECWCGNSLTAAETSYQQCNMLCTGNSTQYCGGSLTLTTYALDVTAPKVVSSSSASRPPTTSSTAKSSTSKVTATSTSKGATSSAAALPWSYVGCYTDSYTRTLKKQVTSPRTVDGCQAACAAAGYSFAGLENWTECWCDNAIQSTGALAAASDCSYPCDQNKNQICGGSWRLSIYKVGQGNALVANVAATSSSSSAPKTTLKTTSLTSLLKSSTTAVLKSSTGAGATSTTKAGTTTSTRAGTTSTTRATTTSSTKSSTTTSKTSTISSTAKTTAKSSASSTTRR